MADLRYVREKRKATITKFEQIDIGSSNKPTESSEYRNLSFNTSTGVFSYSGSGRNNLGKAPQYNSYMNHVYIYTYYRKCTDSKYAEFNTLTSGYYDVVDDDLNTHTHNVNHLATKYYYASPTEYTVGELVETISRGDTNTSLPTDGVFSDYYYYKLLGTDTVIPSSVTHKSAIQPNDTIAITITPSDGKVYGGTITYIIQYTVNGDTWVTAGSTTETLYSLTVPDGAEKFGVRVQTKDDLGYTSSTYVYGNGQTTPSSVIYVDVIPVEGDIGYIATSRIMEIGIDSKEATYSFKATLNGTVLANIASTSETVQEITMSDSQFAGLSGDTLYTLIVEIGQTGGTVTKNYTFRKFVYDNATLSGVFDGMAKALRDKLGTTDSILGAKFPEKVCDLPRLPAITATPDKVFSGNIFADNTGKIRVGTALREKNTATADNIAHGKTAYNSLGELMTGTGSSQYIQTGSLQPTLQNKTYTIPYDAVVSGKKPSCILAYFNTWVGDHATAGRHPSFSPYFFRGAASGQLYGLTTAADGAMMNQNQTGANTTISVGTTSFSVTISQYDYVTGNEFCYILVW